MANISESIEQFIIATMGENDSIDISRNSLADYFAAAEYNVGAMLSCVLMVLIVISTLILNHYSDGTETKGRGGIVK